MSNALKNQATKLPHRPGVYLFLGKQNRPLYIGKAISLKDRVTSYFLKDIGSRTKLMIEKAQKIDFIETGSELTALLLEARLIKLHQPLFNVALKDDKSYLYIFISIGEEFPKVFLTRKPKNLESSKKNKFENYESLRGQYFGPFPSSLTISRVLKKLRRVIPFCQQKQTSRRACFYQHLGLCNPCPSQIKKTAGGEYLRLKKIYRKNIFALKRILDGNLRQVISELKGEMLVKSRSQDYEAAAGLRNQIRQLEFMDQDQHGTQAFMENPNFYFESQLEATDALLEILKPFFTQLRSLERIECYDISNFGPKHIVGAQTVFINGVPEKSAYRRYKIKLVGKQDDFASLTQMLTRRLKHADWPMPDLVVLDGGKPQVSTLQAVFEVLNLSQALIGLAKGREKVIILKAGKFFEISLSKHRPALKLLQQVRDETHRFAISFHRQKRAKAFLN